MDKLYIVSFGNSRKYRLFIDSDDSKKLFDDCEDYLNHVLKQHFPAETFAFYTTPRITEINPDHEADYKDYPTLSREDFPDIGRELLREVEVMNEARERDSNGSHSVPFEEP